jgi:alpha-D-ribose 1-methylphosphonate 5-triphosphate synthase subunit PhnL
MNALLRVVRLTKTFTLHALDGRVVESFRDVDLALQPGEHVAIAGSSGAGKSSVLRCLYRTYRPDSGAVLLHRDGETLELLGLSDRAMARERGRSLGYVAQFLSAPPRTGPLALVRDAAVRRGLARPAAEDAARGSLATFRIPPDLWDVDCSLLSGGERQRVNLAAGTVQSPRLLLLDEPVSALDPVNRENALDAIDALVAEGVTVLAVHHDPDIIRRRAERVVLLEGGRLVSDGAPAHVLEPSGSYR